MRFLGGPLLLISTSGAAQSPGDEPPPVTYPTIPREAATIIGFVPKGWLLESKAAGDLDGDSLPDAAIVLHMTDPRNYASTDWDRNHKYNSNPRMLIVAFARKNGGYALASANHKLVPRLENQNQEDPFDEVAIVNRTLRLKMHIFMSAGGWWMGNIAYTFRWQDGRLRLIGYDRDGVQRNTGETDEVSVNYVSRVKLTKTGTLESGVDKIRRSKIPQRHLLDIDEVGDGFMFWPDER